MDMKKIIGIFVCMLLFIPVFSTIVVADENTPLNPPDIEGPTSGLIDVDHLYIVTLTDPDIDDGLLRLEVDFGDVIIYEDSGCDRIWENGKVLEIYHRWKKSGDYQITARVQDTGGLWSECSDPTPVSMPRQRVLFNQLYDFPLFNRLINLLEIFLKI